MTTNTTSNNINTNNSENTNKIDDLKVLLINNNNEDNNDNDTIHSSINHNTFDDLGNFKGFDRINLINNFLPAR